MAVTPQDFKGVVTGYIKAGCKFGGVYDAGDGRVGCYVVRYGSETVKLSYTAIKVFWPDLHKELEHAKSKMPDRSPAEPRPDTEADLLTAIVNKVLKHLDAELRH